MATYKTPGVYVEEISTLPASVAQVETAIPAFIGYTERASKKGEALTLKPTRIKSLPEYEELFGGAQEETTLTVSITDQGGNRTVVANEPSAGSKYLMWYSMKMYFANGGGPCYIVSVSGYKQDGAVSKTDLSSGLSMLETEDEPTLIVFPDATGVSQAASFYTLYCEALSQCNKLQDRFAIIDTYNQGDTAPATLRSTLSSDYLKYGAAYYPYLKTILNFEYDDTEVTLEHTEIADDDSESEGALHDAKLNTLKGSNDALYNQIKAELGLLSVTLPPSSTMAGVYARVDSDRGVWKAPANVSLNSVIKPTRKITNEEQEGLNVDVTAGKSINAIRSFTGKGILVWGARTLAGNDNEWRYVSVRRFYNMVEESIKKATEKVVFEPNDANTWIKSKAQIENFLGNLWRQGALAGAVPEQAFFVNIGLGQTMTALDILEGRMIIEIGMAVVRPAEFIILRFSHKMQES
ncbi:MAG: phage tail sheath family protein [Roseivirga sp.]|nr:phage tail sheath family protein [Roseivirga sp.]